MGLGTLRSLRILIADDMPAMRMILRDMILLASSVNMAGLTKKKGTSELTAAGAITAKNGKRSLFREASHNDKAPPKEQPTKAQRSIFK